MLSHVAKISATTDVTAVMTAVMSCFVAFFEWRWNGILRPRSRS